jgi:hypothetical protein
MRTAMEDLKLDQMFLVYPVGQSLKLAEKVELVSIRHLPERLQRFGAGEKHS